MKDFIQEMKFERLGVFAYSKEGGHAAAALPHQVRRSPEGRRDRLMALQQNIALESNRAMIGSVLEVLVEERGGRELQRKDLQGCPGNDDSVLSPRGSALPGDFAWVKINKMPLITILRFALPEVYMNLPNKLTLGRVILVPVVFLYMTTGPRSP